MELSLFSKKKIKAFTLIEVMVALFIMSVSTTMLLSNYPDSTIRLTLLNSSHNFSLLIREAQIKGSSIETASTTVAGYGVFIDTALPGQASLFSDSSDDVNNDVVKNNAGLEIGDGIFDETYSPDDVIKDVLKLKEGYVFKKLCVASTTATENLPTPKRFLCSTVNGEEITSLTVSFLRPSQVAHIYINNNTANDYQEACVELYSPKSPTPGHVRSVQVFHAGVITTNAKVCD